MLQSPYFSAWKSSEVHAAAVSAHPEGPAARLMLAQENQLRTVVNIRKP